MTNIQRVARAAIEAGLEGKTLKTYQEWRTFTLLFAKRALPFRG